jgi:hypothetical protein
MAASVASLYSCQVEKIKHRILIRMSVDTGECNRDRRREHQGGGLQVEAFCSAAGALIADRSLKGQPIHRWTKTTVGRNLAGLRTYC